jgi:hypothetical protein
MATTNHSLRLVAVLVATFALAGCVGVLFFVPPKVAQATFPGNNGNIAYSAHDGTADEEIYTIDPTGGTPFQLTNNTTSDYAPSYSPDGQKIAYQHDDGNDEEIYTINASGGTPFQLTNNTTSDSAPSWASTASVASTTYDIQILSSSPSSGDVGTYANDIDVSGNVVGVSVDSFGDRRAFLCTASCTQQSQSETSDSINILGTLGGNFSEANDIGAAFFGEEKKIVGSSTTSAGERHAFVCNLPCPNPDGTGGVKDLGTLGGGLQRGLGHQQLWPDRRGV